MLMINLILSFLFLFMKHPLSMGMTLLSQTIFAALFLGLFNLNYWFSYILMLILIGGMLILFIYMTSVASNEKFKINMNLFMFTLMIMALYLTWTLKEDNFSLNFNYFCNNDMMINKTPVTMTMYYNFPKSLITMMIIIYLLISLIAIVKISKTNQGPLRQMF